jgi:hypothetical protein
VTGAWPFVLLGLLGAYHGLNPAMGWLFAVGLGMQERSRRAVLRSLLPIALGHECSIVLIAALVLGLGVVADSTVLHIGAGVALLAFGVFRFVKPHAHFRWTKMRVNRRELSWWSFLMSTAHGAGLMVAPVLIGAGAASSAQADQMRMPMRGVKLAPGISMPGMDMRSPVAHDHELMHVHDAALSLPGSALGLLLHVTAMVLVMGVVAVVVYDRLGVAVLRRAWLNTEWLWAGAFVVAGVVTLFT